MRDFNVDAPLPLDPGMSLEKMEQESSEVQFLNLLHEQANERIDEQLFRSVHQFGEWFARVYPCHREFKPREDRKEISVDLVIELNGPKYGIGELDRFNHPKVKMRFEIPTTETITSFDQVRYLGVEEVTED